MKKVVDLFLVVPILAALAYMFYVAWRDGSLFDAHLTASTITASAGITPSQKATLTPASSATPAATLTRTPSPSATPTATYTATPAFTDTASATLTPAMDTPETGTPVGRIDRYRRITFVQAG